MRGTSITFAANGGTAEGYLTLPPSGSGPGLIVIQEWWGLVDHIKSIADRFAAEGFVALAPDLFHGERTTAPDQAGKLLMALNIAEAGKSSVAPRCTWVRSRPSCPRQSACSDFAWVVSSRSSPRRSIRT